MNQHEVVFYTRSWGLRCWQTKRFLLRKGYAFETINATDDGQHHVWLAQGTGRGKVPFVFVDGRPVGGLKEILALDRSGNLDRLVRGQV